MAEPLGSTEPGFKTLVERVNKGWVTNVAGTTVDRGVRLTLKKILRIGGIFVDRGTKVDGGDVSVWVGG